MTTKTLIAIARPTSPTTYDVTYPGRRDSDSDVGYGYLRRLAAAGYEVRVGGGGVHPRPHDPGR